MITKTKKAGWDTKRGRANMAALAGVLTRKAVLSAGQHPEHARALSAKADALTGLLAAVQVPTPALYVTGMGRRYPVATVEEASAKWCAFRDASGEGCSTIGNGVRVVDSAGREVARVSYNGRIWIDGKAVAC